MNVSSFPSPTATGASASAKSNSASPSPHGAAGGARIHRCRVVILDDHTAILEMMVPVIESIPGFTVIGHLSNPDEVGPFCASEQPDVVILDWILPRIAGPVLLRQIKQAAPRAHLMIFSGNLWPAAIQDAIGAGVLGIVDKMAALDDFRTAVMTVAAGRTFFSPLISGQIRQLVTTRAARSAPSPIVALSVREKAVLRHLAEGLSSKEIATLLGLSPHTVINHRTNLMRKIGLRRSAQLSLYAAQIGLIGSGVSVSPFAEAAQTR